MSSTQELAPSRPGPDLVGNLHHRLFRQFEVQTADWLDTCRELANWEDQNLVESARPGRLAEHAAILNNLEGVGDWLKSAAGQFGLEAKSTAEQIELTLEDLRDSRAMWHGTLSQVQKSQILRDCFNES